MRLWGWFAFALLLPVAAFPQSAYGTHPVKVANTATNTTATYTPTYTKDGQLIFPAKYREWIYLTSGIDMSYSQKAGAAKDSMFDNVFVNPAAYRSFLQTGTWPDKTVLVLEVRGAESKGSINQRGHYQGTDMMGMEVHVRDTSRFPGNWAFFDFENTVSGKLIARPAACYTCHEQHGAVDTTFVQFYPTLLDIAKKKGTYRIDHP